MAKRVRLDHDPHRVEPGSRLRLQRISTRESGPFDNKQHAEAALAESRKALARAQELFFAAGRYSLLLIFQAMDAAGKDGAIKHVMSGVNPQGCKVISFKAPSAVELDHDFLWRCQRALPELGRIGIFNRSYYEEVLVVRVHPEWLEKQKLPPGPRNRAFWDARYQSINEFERHLVRNGTRILKFFLHVSKDEQKKRFLERLQNPDKHWKFSAADMRERRHWDDYMNAYGEMLGATSTKWAPWFVIPADRKWFARALIADIVVEEIRSLKLSYPEVTPAAHAALLAAQKELLAEG